MTMDNLFTVLLHQSFNKSPYVQENIDINQTMFVIIIEILFEHMREEKMELVTV